MLSFTLSTTLYLTQSQPRTLQNDHVTNILWNTILLIMILINELTRLSTYRSHATIQHAPLLIHHQYTFASSACSFLQYPGICGPYWCLGPRGHSISDSLVRDCLLFHSFSDDYHTNGMCPWNCHWILDVLK